MKRRFVVLFFVIFLKNYAQVDKPQRIEPFVEVTDENGKKDEILIDCNYPLDADRNFVLKADYAQIYETSSYKVAPLKFVDLKTNSAGKEIVISGDDAWSDVCPIPFNFCFYDKTYNKLVILDNGAISFDIKRAGQSLSYTALSLPKPAYQNTIFGAFHDMNNDLNSKGCSKAGKCGKIMRYTKGSAPNRVFIVSYENMNHFNNETKQSTLRIELHETSNVIDVYIKSKPKNNEEEFITEPDEKIEPRKQALIGIQGGKGANNNLPEAVTPPNRNSGDWEAIEEAWRFTPSGKPMSKVVWTDENGKIAEGDQIKVSGEKSNTYTATVTYAVCVNKFTTFSDFKPVIKKDDIKITVSQDFPVAKNVEVTVCDTDGSDDELVTFANYGSLMVGEQKGLKLTYHESKADAKAGVNAITTKTIKSDETFYVRLQRGTSCFDVGELKLKFKKMPNLKITQLDVCDEGNDGSQKIEFSKGIVDNDVEATYYETKEDAENKENAITELTVTNAVKKVFVELKFKDDGACSIIKELPVTLNPFPKKVDVKVPIVCSNISIYDLTQHEAQIKAESGTDVKISYHSTEDKARKNIEPFDPNDKKNPRDPKLYVLKGDGAQEVWVRSVTDKGCLTVFPIKIEKTPGVELDNVNDLQVSTENVFDLKKSIDKLKKNLDNKIIVKYYRDKALTQEITGTEIDNFITTNPETTIYVSFEYKDTSGKCKTIGEIGLKSGAGFGGGPNGGEGACDLGNNSTEEVILSDYDQKVIKNYNDKEFMTVKYYETEDDAINKINPITEKITVTTTPITVFVGITLNVQGGGIKYKVDPLTLSLKRTEEITELVSRTICDVAYDNLEIYNLKDLEDEITTDATAVFKYFDGVEEIEDPTKFELRIPSGEDKKEINVTVTIGDCDLPSKIVLKFHPKIKTKKNQKFLNCDMDNDNTETINLNKGLAILMDNPAGHTAKYYHKKEDAEKDLNAITNVNAYELTKDESIYVRVKDGNGCFTIEKLDLKIVPVPEIKKSVFEFCDFENNHIEQNIDLTKYNRAILGGQNNVEVSYFETEVKAQSNTDEINTVDIVKSDNDTKEVYVKLSVPGSCDIIEPITINLIDSPVINEKITITVCNNSFSNEKKEDANKEEYQLSQSNAKIVSDPTPFSFKYYKTKDDALKNRGAISKITLIADSDKKIPQKAFARITNSKGCYAISELNFKFTFPSKVKDIEVKACDNNLDLTEKFNLNEFLPRMLEDPQKLAGLTATFYREKKAAEQVDQNFLIDKPEEYNSLTDHDVVYVRFSSQETGCFSVAKMDLFVDAIPKLVNGSYAICDTDFDGDYVLDLKDLHPEIMQSDEGMRFDYYESKNDALQEVHKITNPTNYVVPKDHHNIYIRVHNKANCWSIAKVRIDLGKSVAVNKITDVLKSCDDDLDNFSTFDLTSFASKFTSEPDATFKYYANEENAKNQQSEIAYPTNYRNEVPENQTIYVRVSAPTKCDAITSFKISTIHIKDPLLKDISICKGDEAILDPGNQYASYVWSTSETTQSIKVATAGAYSVTLTDSKGCQGTFKVKVSENDLPVVKPYEKTVCHTADFKSFNLEEYTSSLTDTSDNIVEFYLSESDMNSGVNKLNSSFTNTENPQTIYAKVKNKLGCHDTTTLTLEVVKYPGKPVVEKPYLKYEYDQKAEPLKATAVDGNSLIWYTEQTGDNEMTSSIPSTKKVGRTDYWVSQINASGCESERSKVTVEVAKPAIKIYNEFTPNNDAYNNSFRIEYIEMYENNSIEIYNRWGTLVFKMKGYTNDSSKSFIGKSNVKGSLGEKLVIGVYFYLIDLGDGSEVKKGWLHINR